MTLQEALHRITTLLAPLDEQSSSADFARVQTQLRLLNASLPRTPDFNDLSDAIVATMAQLTGQAAYIAVKELRSRATALALAGGVVNKVAAEADKDARGLKFEQARAVADGLKSSIIVAQELGQAVQARDTQVASTKLNELMALLQALQAKVKID